MFEQTDQPGTRSGLQITENSVHHGNFFKQKTEMITSTLPSHFLLL
jgi:hypothetical protein